MGIEQTCSGRKEVIIGKVLTLSQCLLPNGGPCEYRGKPFKLYDFSAKPAIEYEIMKCYLK